MKQFVLSNIINTNRKFLFSIVFLLIGASVVTVMHAYQSVHLDAKNTEALALLENPTELKGRKSIARFSKTFNQVVFSNKNTLSLTYNLHGLCLLEGIASIVSLKQNSNDHSVSLSSYGKNCYDGEQTVAIPLTHFKGLDLEKNIDSLMISVWYPTDFDITLNKVIAHYSQSVVLGEAEPKKEESRTFPSITPIRSQPYAPYETQR